MIYHFDFLSLIEEIGKELKVLTRNVDKLERFIFDEVNKAFSNFRTKTPNVVVMNNINKFALM